MNLCKGQNFTKGALEDMEWIVVSRGKERCSKPLYEGMHRMICKLAWRYAKQCSLNVEDLINEGYSVLLKVQNKYDPSRASRSTFVYWVVRNHLWQLSRRWPINSELPEHLPDGDYLSTLEDGDVFRTKIHALSDEAKEVIRIILSCPQELCEMAKNGSPKRLQKMLGKILSKQGWAQEGIFRIMQEIREAKL